MWGDIGQDLERVGCVDRSLGVYSHEQLIWLARDFCNTTHTVPVKRSTIAVPETS